MNDRISTTRSTLLDTAKRKRLIVVLGSLLGILLAAELAFQFALRMGWNTYSGLDTISAVAVDRQERAWVAGYRREQRSLMTYSDSGKPVEVPLPGELGGGQIISLMIDKQDHVWLGTEGGKVAMLDSNGQWTLYSSITEEDIRQIVMDGQGRVWVRSHRGPAKIDPDSGDRTFLLADPALMDHDSIALAIDPQGQLWALTRQREIRVLEADNRWRTVVIAPATVRNGPADSFLTFDPQGQMWMATVQGVGVLSPNGSWMEHPLGDPYRPLSLHDVVVDDKGHVWVAAFQPRSNNAESFTGLFQFEPQAGWKEYSNRNSGLRGDVNLLALDPAGRIWMGSAQGGVSKFDPAISLPVEILSIIRFGVQALVPGILISAVLLAVIATLQIRPVAPDAGQILKFSLGFAAWYAVGVLMWWYLRASSQPSGPVFFYINPLILVTPVIQLALLAFFYFKQRQMARGAISAIAVNSIGMLFLSPFGIASMSTSLFAAIFMIPFFLLN